MEGSENKVVLGDDNSKKNTYHFQKGKLATLFESLKEKFETGDTITKISEDLKRYKDSRDRVDIEQKLKNAGREHLLDDFVWLKDQYFRKLTKFQFFEPAQEIHAFILGIVFEKFRSLIYPMIRNKSSEEEILKTISVEITSPIVSLIEAEGCDDVMGLSATDVEGMIHFLTGQCHLKWEL
ncbi:MAG: hypothetical protein HRT71_03980 [Flavobacteriales bacterium]|nr:hypothetical protein [Flavobacteriales bacterium]